ncbi:MAG: hypothetical protein Q8L26_00475 [Candidatus Omnitrophota bacterium]|nr:hypothetical protein [Candidatus Omnitrophota bacterium]
MQKVKLIVAVFLFSFSCLLFSASPVLSQAEDITITNYYPSPFGVYGDLEAQRARVGFPVGDVTWWPNFAIVRTGYGDVIGIGGDAGANDLEIRISDGATFSNTVTFWNIRTAQLARIQAAGLGCRLMTFTANDVPSLMQCGDWNNNGVCTDAGESCTSRLSYIPFTQGGTCTTSAASTSCTDMVLPKAGSMMCCET